MKKQHLLPMVLGTVLLAFLPFKNTAVDELTIGSKAPLTEHKIEEVSGKMISLQEMAGESGLLVIFSCNTCPWVAKWEDRYNPIAELAENNNIGVIALNPNAGYRDQGESMQDMKVRARKSNYQFAYALDKGAKLASAFGATRTPHIFLFNGNMELVYRGAIDDNADSAAEVDQPYLKNAIKNLASGNKIDPQTTKSFGCTIKWPE